jgi:hypothetical protein
MKTINDEINAAIKKWNEVILKLLESGTTYQRTAEIAGCSISKVQYIAKQHGLTRRKSDDNKAE